MGNAVDVTTLPFHLCNHYSTRWQKKSTVCAPAQGNMCRDPLYPHPKMNILTTTNKVRRQTQVLTGEIFYVFYTGMLRCGSVLKRNRST